MADVDIKDAVFTMEEAMEYLKISSRSTFYKLLRQKKIKYVDLNPDGDYEIRRFKKSALDEYLTGQAFK